ncbi:LacI-type HTH domain protein [Acididesulfobacillus acetoxydans]|uniref:HTH-type transcriptional regulator MalR n=1 Tax=Acididesulfobacillus acetoxydans TaxID=1561005 RepID=A0A8S0Y316_9FIRM|nr:LacI family DNA-binding transcriptional regulator [Acididesulfobacillus acetoxydans]CAA7601475.1 LacI-type HTH domain protein [Acididesulfobacillus acetoxydans]CEJ06130.1 HTH-type transcriptional regulator MalR [Acididesulfobacillus acetoxydans]
MKHTVTIRDVAKKVGVSASTVSRVIANSPLISEETREVVRKAMEEMGYFPNAVARSLANAQTRTIAVVMPSSAELAFQNPFFPEAIRGIGGVTSEQRYDLLLLTPVTAEDEYRETLRVVKERRVDGIIFLYSRSDQKVLAELAEMGFPQVLIGRPLEDLPLTWVDNDNIEASRSVTAELIRLGHRIIGFMSGPPNFVVSQDRLEGYKRALADGGITWDPECVCSADFLEEEGYRAAGKLLDGRPNLTAVVTMDDIMAFGVMRAARERGLDLPRELSLVSFNNSPLAQHMTPPLSSVEIQAHELGATAARLLLSQLELQQATSEHCFVQVSLVRRNSMAPVKFL